MAMGSKQRTNHKKGIDKAEKARRRKEAEARRAEYAALTPAQRIARLDARLGKGVGAAKERARLAALSARLSPEPKVKTPKTDKHSKQTPPAVGEYAPKKG